VLFGPRPCVQWRWRCRTSLHRRAEPERAAWLCKPAMVAFNQKAVDEAEERAIKGTPEPAGVGPAAEEEEEEVPGGGGVDQPEFGEKSVSPNKKDAPEEDHGFYVTILKLEGSTLGPFLMESGATVGDLKAQIEAAETGTTLGAMPTAQQRLFFEVPKSTGKVISSSSLAPAIPWTQIHGWTGEWPQRMQNRPLRKGRADQKLSELGLGLGFNKRTRPDGSVAITVWLIPRPMPLPEGQTELQLDYDDRDIAIHNLRRASTATVGNLNLKVRVEDDKSPRASRCSVM